MSRALTVRQPWASLIALGIKRIETRSWSTTYRGPLAIHAGKKRADGATLLDLVGRHGEVWDAWCRADLVSLDGERDTYPLGAVVATCTLVDVVPIMRCDDVPAGHPGDRPETLVRVHEDALQHYLPGEISMLTRYDDWSIDDQRPFGDFTPGRFAWLLDDVKPTTERCPRCWGVGQAKVPIVVVGGAYPDPDDKTALATCPTCRGDGSCDPVPARGKQGLWSWEPSGSVEETPNE